MMKSSIIFENYMKHLNLEGVLSAVERIRFGKWANNIIERRGGTHKNHISFVFRVFTHKKNIITTEQTTTFTLTRMKINKNIYVRLSSLLVFIFSSYQLSTICRAWHSRLCFDDDDAMLYMFSFFFF